jgi:GTPase SAR1 family protein
MLTDQPVVALVGKVGHGKTLLLNKLTGSRFESNMKARSCTRTLQHGLAQDLGIMVVDTPGFCASDDVAAHIAAQKLALEGTPLSGIYIIVKFGRADDIGEMADKIMKFIGNDDVRIIITFADTVSGEDGYNTTEMKDRLHKMLEISQDHIAIVGKDTPKRKIEDFIFATLHSPKHFHISDEQVALISSLCVSTRHFNKRIESIYARIAAASKSCADLTLQGKTQEADHAITTLQKVTADMVRTAKEDIFREAEDRNLSEEQKHLIYGKAGLALAIRLRAFITASNSMLTWDVTSPDDQRNDYRACNYCGAIYNKTTGCNGPTICGALPGDVRRDRPKLIAEFRYHNTGWFVQYFWDDAEVQVNYVLGRLRDIFHRTAVSWGGQSTHRKPDHAVIESGCGQTIKWSSMRHINPAQLQELGVIELENPGTDELRSKSTFDSRMRHYAELNKGVLDQANLKKK